MISIKLTCFYSRDSFESIYLKKAVNRLQEKDKTIEVDSWIDEIKMNSSPDIKIFLVGTKSDLEEDRQVQFSEGEMLKNKYNLDEFMEVSAQEGTNTKELFLKAVLLLLSKYQNLKGNFNIPNSRTISDVHSLKKEVKNKKKYCIC